MVFCNNIHGGVNDQDRVVGHFRNFPADNRAFLWQDGTMYDLNELIPTDSGWALRFASDINNAGSIVGWGVNPQGLSRAFLLTPVPEPGALVPLMISVLMLVRRRQR